MFVYKLLLEFHKIWDIIDKFQPHFPIKKVRLFSVQYPKILFSFVSSVQKKYSLCFRHEVGRGGFEKYRFGGKFRGVIRR